MEKETKNTNLPNKTAIYADIISAIIISAMFCGTFLSMCNMWFEERKLEIAYLRSTNP